MRRGSAWRGAPGEILAVALLVSGCVSARGYREAQERLGEAEVLPPRRHQAEVTGGFISPPSLAEPMTAAPLPDDLSVYVREAARHNAGLRAAFERWRAALERAPQATALPDPMLTYDYFIQTIETRVGPQRHRLMFSQKFPWFGKLDLRGRMALAAAAAAEQDVEAERLRLTYEVTRVYHEYAYLAASIRITRENQRLLANVEEVARTLLTVGKAPQQHVIAAQVELARLADRLQSLTDRRRVVVAELNALLNRPADAPLEWPAAKEEEAAMPEEAGLLTAFRDRNPTLLGLDQRIALARAAVDLARKEYFPDVTLGLTWVETGEGMMPSPDSGQDAVLAMASVNLPIWQEKLRAGVREATAAREAATAARREMQNRLRARLEAALFALRDADRQVRLYADSLIPKAEQAYGAAQAGYTAGAVDFQGFVDSQRLLLSFQLARERALADRAQRLAEVRMLAPAEAAP